VRISIGEEGFNNNGNTSVAPAEVPVKFTFSDSFAQVGPPQKAMSDDGSRVFFQSSAGLTPGAFDNVELPGFPGHFARNIYEYHDGHISLITGGQDLTVINAGGKESSVKLFGTTSDGNDVFFTTASPLVPEDEDASTDLYDARVDGGFPVTSSSPCSGEACQGAPASTPTAPSPTTSTFSGPSNPKPVHKKHKKKHHKKAHHKKKHKRSAGAKHGGSK
jgi:hypothetical protein